MKDLFGDEWIDEPPVKRHAARKPTMQEMYGLHEGKKCRTCSHCVAVRFNRTYYKCDAWGITSSTSTDIKVNQTACAKYKDRETLK